MLRLAPALAVFVMIGPTAAGLLGAALPAFGILPVLGGDTLSFAPWRELFAAPGIWRSIGLSLWTGAAATLLAFLLVALLIGAWWNTPVLGWVERLLAPLLSVPHAAAALGLAFLIAPSGWLMRLASPALTGFERPPDLLIVHDPAGLTAIAGLAVKEAAFLFLMVLSALPQIKADKALRIAASFGYGRIAAFVYAVLPQLYRQIRLPIFAVLAFAASNVQVALILGPTTPPTLAVRLVEWLSAPDLDRRFVASAGAMLQLGLVLGLIASWCLLARVAGAFCGRVRASGIRFRRDAVLRWLVLIIALVAGAAVFLSIAGLGLWSVAGVWRFPEPFPESLTLSRWRSQGGAIAGPLLATIVIAAASAAIALALATASLEAGERRGQPALSRWLLIIYLPLIVPQIVFLFGLDILFLLMRIPPSLASVVFAHLVFVLPYVLLALADPWRALDPRFSRVARGFGASENRIFWRIRAPMLAAPLLTALALGVAVSVGLYLPTLLIGDGRITTVTTEAVALSAGGNRRLIGIMVMLQMAVPLVAFTAARIIPAALFRERRGLRVRGVA